MAKPEQYTVRMPASRKFTAADLDERWQSSGAGIEVQTNFTAQLNQEEFHRLMGPETNMVEYLIHEGYLEDGGWSIKVTPEDVLGNAPMQMLATALGRKEGSEAPELQENEQLRTTADIGLAAMSFLMKIYDFHDHPEEMTEEFFDEVAEETEITRAELVRPKGALATSEPATSEPATSEPG